MIAFNCKAVLFDLDGVLIDSSAVVERHWRRWASRCGVPFEHVLAVFHGRRSFEVIRIVAPHLDAVAEGRRLDAEEALDTDGLRVFDGAQALLGAMSPEVWAVVTSGNTPTARTRLQFGRFPWPRVLVTADDVRHGKPAPDGYLLAADRLGVAPPDCLVVEDAPAGVEAARAAGMPVVAVLTTHAPGALQRADAIVRRLSDLHVSEEASGLRVRATPPPRRDSVTAGCRR
jgi:sugar-phosphatase